VAPGDATDAQIDLIADLADALQFRRGACDPHAEPAARRRGTGEDLRAVAALDEADLATPNIGTLTDMICCPGLDFCSLANAGSIDVAKLINERFDDYDYLVRAGRIDVKMSGCMNACGHHHVGNIGILGVDKGGEEWYQITIGGAAGAEASLGFGHRPVRRQSTTCRRRIARLLEVYVEQRRLGRALSRHRAPSRREAVQGEGVCRAGCCVTAGSSRTIGVPGERGTTLRDAGR
jgi:sulfite reductase (NADPH) hemoprotein beta-component